MTEPGVPTPDPAHVPVQDPATDTDSTRETLKRLYLALKAEKRQRVALEAARSEPVAIIGMACRFPAGANDPAAFWDLLESGRDGVATVPPDRWRAAEWRAPEGAPDTPGTMVTDQGGFLDVPLNRFDHAFFRIAPREARALDPQHRLLLEITWEALEGAGILPAALKGSRTGVFVGLSGDDYMMAHRHGPDPAAIDAYSVTGSTPSTAAGRIAYVLGLEGPAVPVDTACSSSLVALHLACQSLRAGETDLVLAGGVNLILAPSTHVCFSRLHALAPDGRCKSFDAAADGYGRGEGCGMIALKRLSDARRDGDRILALVEATAVNQDGASNGFTAPNGGAQRRLLAEALARAGLSPTDIQVLEAHGTGTPLGDPIEAEAALDVLGQDRAADAPLILGAVKSAIGHLEAAAGIAGILKVILALRHGRIPPNRHFHGGNPLIPWDRVPLTVPTAPLPWPAGPDGRRHAGISSFGFSGTNAHAILGSPPKADPVAYGEDADAPHLLALSAHSAEALAVWRARLAAHLRALPSGASVRDICATLLRRRTVFAHRWAVVGRTAADLADQLEAETPHDDPTAPEALRRAAQDWRDGQAVDGPALYPEALYPDETWRLADLPRRAFDPLPCALGPLDGPIIPTAATRHAQPAGEDPAPHPLLTRAWQSPLIGERLWEGTLDLSALPLLADHRVFGHAVVPAAAVLSMMLAAGRAHLGDLPFALTDVSLTAPLTVPERGAVTIHLVLRPTGEDGAARLDLASLTVGGAVRHASAALRPLDTAPAGRGQDPGPNARPVDPAAIFQGQGERLTLGPAFRWDDGVWREDEREAGRHVLHLRTPDGVDAAPWAATCHPGLLDAALHPLAALMNAEDGAALVPAAFDRVEVGPQTPSAAIWGATWAEARVPDPAARIGTVALWDANGRVLMRMEGVRGRPLSAEALRHAVASPIPPSPAPAAGALRDVPPADRPAHLQAILRAALADALGATGPDAVPTDRDLVALGMDSLMALKVRDAAEAALGRRLPATVAFDHPSLGALTAALLVEDVATAPAATTTLPTAAPADPGALSAGQAGLWLLHQVAPDSAAFHTCFAARVRGGLDRATLTAAVHALAARHAPLRSVVTAPEGTPRLHPLDPDTITVDWQGAPGQTLDSLRPAIDAAYRRPFRLDRDPPLRAVVWSMGEDDHVLLLVIHHIAVDVWAFGRILEELAADYALARDGGTPDRTPPRPSYADVVAARSALLAGAEGERLRRAWRARLADLGPNHPPPLARPTAAAAARLEGQTLHVHLDAARTEALDRLGRAHGATLYMTLLAVWFALATRLDDPGHDLIVGAPVHGRNDPAWAQVVGFLVNVVPVRVSAGDDPAWTALLERTRKAMLAAMADQALPFQAIANEAGANLDTDALHPLIQTLVHLRTLDEAADLEAFFVPGRSARVGFGPWTLEPVYLDQQEGQYPLVVEWIRTSEGLTGLFKYATAQYDASTVARLAELCFTLIDGVLAAPDAPLGALDLLGETGRATLAALNPPLRAHASVSRVDVRLAAQAARTPDAVAVEVGDTTLSYRTLDRRANALAHRLATAGARPGERVALCAPRGAALIVALVAISKTGAAWVPVDPDLPTDRLRETLADAAPVVLLAGAPLTAPDGCTVLPLNASTDEADAPPDSGRADGNTPLYVLYTSGTTGTPKGVVVGHAAVCAHLDAMDARLPLSADDAVLVQTPLTFDPSVAQILRPLVCGARLIVAGADDHRDPAELAARIVSAGVTAMYSVPSQIRALLEEPALAKGTARLRTVFSGGEILPPDLPARMAAVCPGATLVNVYGPTEATVLVTTWACRPTTSADDGPVPIGRPLDCARVVLLDSAMRPVPPGVPGDLYIGGPCLADGYWRRPELMAAAFLPDPEAPDVRLYRTGDRARLDPAPDGSGAPVLVFLGRADSQVKLRGIRLELGEVEAVARAHPGIAAAAAHLLPPPMPGGEARLGVVVVPADPDRPPSSDALTAHAAGRLPPAVVPRLWRVVPALPLTRHGKIDGAALDTLLAEDAPAGTPPAPGSTAAIVADVWRAVLGTDAINPHRPFMDHGGSSLGLTRVRRLLEARGFTGLRLLDLFRHPTVAGLAAVLDGTDTARPASSAPLAKTEDHAIAVIGMAARLPGAPDLDAFATMVETGHIGLTRFDRDALLRAGVPAEHLDDPAYVPVNGVLDGVEDFDASAFGLAPSEAEILDPQQRVFLEVAWHALDHAGHGARRPGNRTGVFAGSDTSTYLLFNLGDRLNPAEMNGGYALSLANDKDFLATRTAWNLDLHGPAVTVQTACSTSLTAVATACDALTAGRCDTALAGGVSITLPQGQGYRYREGLVVAPDGVCRPFDARAGGTVNGNGVGVVVLKPLARALADGDTIHAVLRGWAMNNDGAGKAGFTAPSENAQAEAVVEAWHHAGIDPARLGYIEAHGTGTAVGDPIEVAALTRAWGDRPRPADPVRLGSAKAAVGHTGAASGVTGLIRAVLAVGRRRIPPQPAFEVPNPALDLDAAPFTVQADGGDWPVDRPGLALAAVSSFGIGGTNVHVVIEAPPPQSVTSDEGGGPHVLPLSAGSAEGLARARTALAAHLKAAGDDLRLADVAWTLQAGRNAYDWRTAVVADTLDEAAAALDAAQPGRRAVLDAPVVALFPGQGAQHPDMLRDLYTGRPDVRADIDGLLDTLAELDGAPSAATVRAMIMPGLERPGDSAVRADAAAFLARTENTQPVLFIAELALARLWARLGVVPSLMLGHSVGEYVAATLAGVFAPDDALALVAARGRLMQSLPPGRMLAVPLAAEAVAPYLGPDVSLAGDNVPMQSVLSGPPEAIAAVRDRLAGAGVTTQDLATSHAFHSAMMDPILPDFRRVVERVSRQVPRPDRRVVSCLTGTWLTAEQACDPDYWVAQLRGTVRFRAGVETLRTATPAPIALLEIGPGQALSGQARRLLGRSPDAPPVLATARRDRDNGGDRAPLLRTAAALWTLGIPLDWTALRGPDDTPRPRRVPLPGYPFDRQRYWIEPGAPRKATPPAVPQGARLFVPVWRATIWPEATDSHCRVTGGPGDLAAAVTARLGTDDAAPAPAHVHLIDPAATGPDRLADTLAGLGALARDLATRPDQRATLLLVTWNGQDTGGGDTGRLDPGAAAVAGPALAIGRELPWVRTQLIDLDGTAPPDPDALAAILRRELSEAVHDPIAAWRGGRRLVRAMEPLPWSPTPATTLPPDPVCLVTGGLGGIGRRVADWLVRTRSARVVLSGRTPLDRLTADQTAALAALGEQARYVTADVSDPDAAKALVAETVAAFGRLDVVFHAAGIADPAPIAETNAAAITRTLAPKLSGAQALADACTDVPLRAVVLFSSSSAVLGRQGLGIYAGANAALDALAARLMAQGRPAVSIGWDAWADIGLSAGFGVTDSKQAAAALSGAEALGALGDILALPGLPHVLVSGADMAAMLAEITTTAEAAPARPVATSGGHPRPDLAVPYRPPTTKTERRIAAVWEEILGVCGIGADDAFFDLGGDSLIGGRLILRLNEALGTAHSPVLLYEAPTVRAMAQAMDTSAATEAPSRDETPRRSGRQRRRARQDREDPQA